MGLGKDDFIESIHCSYYCTIYIYDVIHFCDSMVNL